MFDTSHFARGQIWWRTNTRDEEGKSIQKKVRPVLIVSNTAGLAASNIAIVVPLTTAPRWRPLPTQVKLRMQGAHNIAMCEQMYCTSTEFFGEYICTVTSQKMREIDKALNIAIGSDAVLEDYYNEDFVEQADDEAVSSEPTEFGAAVLAALTSEPKASRKPAKKPKIKKAPEAAAEAEPEKSAVCVASNKRKKYSDDDKLDLLIAAEQGRNSGVKTRAEIAAKWGYCSWKSFIAYANKLKRELK